MKLLQKTIRLYLLYSVFILLVTIPVFYYVIQNIIRESVDEDLLSRKTALQENITARLRLQPGDSLVFLDQDLELQSSLIREPFDSFSTEELFDVREKEMIPHRFLRANFLVNGQPYLMQLRTSLLETDDLVRSLVKVQALLLLLLLGGLIIINRHLSKWIWKPFYHTLGKLREFNIEKEPGIELPSSPVTEFNLLNEAVTDLTGRAHQSFTLQKEFTENASHEMQTPLAVLQSKLELLMQTSPLNQEQAGLIDALADAAVRMTRLNKSLLLLTKIENNQFPDKEELMLTQMLEEFSTLYQAQVQQKHLALEFFFQHEVVLIANKVLIEILLSNLFGNAIRHNRENGRIETHLSENKLLIRNSGVNHSLDADKLFHRFQKESTDSNSIGLGLEMSKKICALYGYHLSYQFENNLHEFILDFSAGALPKQ
ncbi:MAG: hypothetical protein JWQ27_2260 [Ferruginibacter sp.]|nr:hypothetical protein [Ferruginibacter sp.]